jgi:hypothetical protein
MQKKLKADPNKNPAWMNVHQQRGHGARRRLFSYAESGKLGKPAGHDASLRAEKSYQQNAPRVCLPPVFIPFPLFKLE